MQINGKISYVHGYKEITLLKMLILDPELPKQY